MSRSHCVKLVVSLVLLPLFAAPPASAAQHGRVPDQVEVATVMKEVFPALVRIFVVSTRYQQGREIKLGAAGSGTIITPDGYVVTNHHVAGKAVRIWVTLSNHQRVDAELVGTDPMTDIAVIKLLPESMRHPVKRFPFSRWGDSSKLKVGQKVFAMGSPGALSQSVTYGIISNPKVVMPGRGMVLDGEPVGTLVRWIFHDAQIYHGNSGGPLVDIDGRIVGVNEIGVAALGGAIPAQTARKIAEEIIRHGFVDRSWSGIQVQKLLYTDKNDEGVLVSGVTPGSPAAIAGVVPGDKILAVQGQPIQVRFAEQMPEFHRAILEAPIGTTLKLRVLRDGGKIDLLLKTEARGKAMAPQKELAGWGITAMDVTRLLRLNLRLGEVQGVLVSSINPGGPAGLAKPRLQGYDVITRVGGQPVKNVMELAAVTRRITGSAKEAVPTVVAFWRDGQELLTSVDIGPKKDPEVIPGVRKSWFPAKVQVMTKTLAKTLGIKGVRGVRITRLYPQMRKAKFLVGDILTHMDGMRIDAWEPAHAQRFPSMVRRYKPGTEAVFTILRNGEKLKIAYSLLREPVPDRELDKCRNEFLEFEARDLSVMDRIERRYPQEQKGVMVTSVKSGSWAQLGGLRAGQLILSVNGQKVESAKDLARIMSKVEEDKPAAIIVFVKHGIRTSFVEIRPDWNRK